MLSCNPVYMTFGNVGLGFAQNDAVGSVWYDTKYMNF